jgi:hypothetical protein
MGDIPLPFFFPAPFCTDSDAAPGHGTYILRLLGTTLARHETVERMVREEAERVLRNNE